MNTSSGVEKFFNVAFRTQTYSNLLYLLLSFPLSIFYFVFLVTGISLGIGLAILWVGLLILGLVIASWVGLAAFERQMAIGMLGEKIAPMNIGDLTNKTLWQKFTSLLGSATTWKSLLYLLLKFPLGIVNFVALVTLLSVSLAFATAPLYYTWLNPQVNLLDGAGHYGIWIIDTPVEAALFCLAGLALFFLSLHALNGLAWVSGKFAKVMLGDATGPAVHASPLAPTVQPVEPAPAPVTAPAPAPEPSTQPSDTPDDPSI